MCATQDRLATLTREIQRSEDQIQLESVTVPITVFETGAFVLVASREGSPSRLHTPWLGPMRILSSKGSEYLLLNLVNRKEKHYHAKHMKHFIFNPHNTTPIDIDRRDYIEFFVGKILAHTGNPTRTGSLFFIVKWSAYDETHNTWEPYTGLRKTEHLHAYLREKNLLGLIPQEFRTKTR